MAGARVTNEAAPGRRRSGESQDHTATQWQRQCVGRAPTGPSLRPVPPAHGPCRRCRSGVDGPPRRGSSQSAGRRRCCGCQCAPPPLPLPPLHRHDHACRALRDAAAAAAAAVAVAAVAAALHQSLPLPALWLSCGCNGCVGAVGCPPVGVDHLTWRDEHAGCYPPAAQVSAALMRGSPCPFCPPAGPPSPASVRTPGVLVAGVVETGAAGTPCADDGGCQRNALELAAMQVQRRGSWSWPTLSQAAHSGPAFPVARPGPSSTRTRVRPPACDAHRYGGRWLREPGGVSPGQGRCKGGCGAGCWFPPAAMGRLPREWWVPRSSKSRHRNRLVYWGFTTEMDWMPGIEHPPVVNPQ
jgi:hypothetical protein